MDQFFSSIEFQDVVGTVLLMLLGLGMRWVAKRAKLSDATTEAIDGIHAAVAIVKAEYVDDLKRASADGVLTAEERKSALDKAVSKVFQILKGDALQLAQSWGMEKLKGLIELAVGKLKGGSLGKLISSGDAAPVEGSAK